MEESLRQFLINARASERLGFAGPVAAWWLGLLREQWSAGSTYVQHTYKRRSLPSFWSSAGVLS